VAAVTFPIVGRHRHGEDDDTVAILDGAPVDVPLHTPAPRVPGWLRVTREDLPLVDDPARRKRRLAGLFAAAAAGLAVLIALTSVLSSPSQRGIDRGGVPGPGDVAAGTPGGGVPVPGPATETPAPSASPSATRPAAATSPTRSPARRPTPTRSTSRTAASSPTTSAPITIAGTTAAATTAPTNVLAVGTQRSLRLASSSDRYLARRTDLADLVTVTSRSSASTRDDATLTVVAGLADGNCFTFRNSGGRYLRHRDYRLRFENDNGSSLFKSDATFCVRNLSDGAIALESKNYPDYYISTSWDGRFWIERHPRTSDAAFRVTAPLA
jgi:hypothetical protein